MSSSTRNKLFLLPFFLIGLGMVCAAVARGVQNSHFIQSASRVPGRITSFARGPTSPETGSSEVPRLTFIDLAGVPHSVVSRRGFRTLSQYDRQSIDILYDPADPALAEPEGISAWQGPLIMSLVGGGFLILSSIGYLAIFKDDRNERRLLRSMLARNYLAAPSYRSPQLS